MQTQQLIHHSFELRLAAALFLAVGFFAVAKLAAFIDEKITSFSQREKNDSANYTVAVSTR